MPGRLFREAPLAATAVALTLGGPVATVAQLCISAWLFSLCVGPDPVPTAALVMLLPFLLALLMVFGTAFAAMVVATASVVRREPRTRMAVGAWALNALLIGSAILRVGVRAVLD